MKKLFYILIFFCFVFSLNAQQNLVLNPSFEDTIGGCPNNISQINKTKYWFKTNATPDYFHRCYNGTFNYCNVPTNGFGYQTPNHSSCNAYLGIQTSAPGFNNANETFCIKLSDSLTKNQKYYVSLKVSLGNNYKYASNNIGLLYSTKTPSISGNSAPNNFCQINFSQVINDTLNWTSLFKSFTADSNYKYLSMGNFKDSSLTTKVLFNPSGFVGSYYFIDDICCSTDSSFVYNYTFNCSSTYIDERIINQIKIFPNPAYNKINISHVNELSFSVKIFDINGYKILSKNEMITDEIDISSLSNGIYFIEVSTNSFRKKEKLIIQK